MKTIRKNVYYCEYCDKKGLSAFHVKKHEIHCTANPNRDCKMCENVWGYKPEIALLKKRYKVIEDEEDLRWVEWIGNPVTIEEILDIADGCPACALSIIKLSGMNFRYFEFPEQWYEEAKKIWWADKNKYQESQYEYM